VRAARDDAIFRTAWSLFEAEPWAGRPVRLIGLGLSDWARETDGQRDLFDTEATAPDPRDGRLDEARDAIKRKFGQGYLQRGLNRRN